LIGNPGFYQIGLLDLLVLSQYFSREGKNEICHNFQAKLDMTTVYLSIIYRTYGALYLFIHLPDAYASGLKYSTPMV